MPSFLYSLIPNCGCRPVDRIKAHYRQKGFQSFLQKIFCFFSLLVFLEIALPCKKIDVVIRIVVVVERKATSAEKGRLDTVEKESKMGKKKVLFTESLLKASKSTLFSG